MPIEWDHLTRPEFDRIVEALIHRLYDDHDAEVVAYDGRGGDGGRDVVVRAGSRVLVFQLKYFPDGFSSERRSRRKQIKRSFEAATAHEQPTAWFLVVPTNPTPGEEKFVRDLAASVPGLRAKIWGRTDLNTRLAMHQDLVDYFNRDSLREAARDYGREQAILARGLPDLTDRYQALSRVAESLDPYWRVDTAVRGNVIEHKLRAKHPRASQLSPITFTAQLNFGPKDAGLQAAVRRSIGFGTSESVNLPAVNIENFTVAGPAWLEIPAKGVEITWRPADPPPDSPRSAAIDVFDDDGVMLSSHHGMVSHSGSGAEGYSVEVKLNAAATLMVLIGRDGVIQLNCNFGFSDVLPAIARENIMLFRSLHLSRSLTLRLDSTPVVRSTREGTGAIDKVIEEDLAIRESLVEDLEIVQRHCRAYFPVPNRVSFADRVDIRIARLLIEGHCVVSRTARTWTVELNGRHSKEFDKVLANDQPGTLRIAVPLVLHMFGQELHLGEVSYFHTQVEIPDASKALAALRRGRGAGQRLAISPINKQHFRMYLHAAWVGRDDERLVPTPWGLPGLDGPPNG